MRMWRRKCCAPRMAGDAVLKARRLRMDGDVVMVVVVVVEEEAEADEDEGNTMR